jgi:hypothetical protein
MWRGIRSASASCSEPGWSVPLLLTASLLGYGASTVSILALYFAAMLPMSLAQGFGMAYRAFDRMGRDALVSVLNSAAGLALVVAALARSGGLIAVGLCQLAAGVVPLVARAGSTKACERNCSPSRVKWRAISGQAERRSYS